MTKDQKHRGDVSWCECSCHTEGSPQIDCESCYTRPSQTQDSGFNVVNDCSGSNSHLEDCQGCEEVIIVKPKEIKDFIRSHDSQIRERLVEKIKEKRLKNWEDDHGYNLAISNVIALIKEKL